MARLIDEKTLRLELDKLDCIDKFGYVILPITKFNIALETSTVDAVPVEKPIRPMTNADKIRQMTDEELAEYLCDRTSECYRCEGCGKCQYDKEKEMMTGMIDWLKQEVESDG